MNLNELRDEAYSIAKAHGWHDEETTGVDYEDALRQRELELYELFS